MPSLHSLFPVIPYRLNFPFLSFQIKVGKDGFWAKNTCPFAWVTKETDGNEIKVFSFLELRPKKALSLQKPLLPVHTVPKEWS